MTITGLIILVVAFILYFLPTIVASGREHKTGTSLLIINLFLGWTVIGWIACLAWAYAAPKKEKDDSVAPVEKK